MSPTHRVDTGHTERRGPSEKVLQTMSLGRRRHIQSLGLEFRNTLVWILRSQSVDDAVKTARPHGDALYHDEVVQAALDLERASGSDTSSDVVRALEMIRDRVKVATEPAPAPAADVDQILQRLNAGGEPRANDTDLTDADWERLVSGASPEIQGIIRQTRDDNRALRRLLDHHDKFDTMLNSKAFERDMNASDKPGQFVFFDLINFKNYNSRYSYDFVDHVILDRLCLVLSHSLPEGSLTSIKGGDEFMIFIPDAADGPPADARQAATLVAETVQRAMQSIGIEDIRGARKWLPKKKGSALSGLVQGARSLFLRETEEDTQRRNEEQALEDVRRLHGKISAVRRTPDMKCSAAVKATEAGLKSVSSWHYRANMRFPSAVVEENGGISKPFSATGAEVRDFFIGATNDAGDLFARLMR